MSKLLFWYTYMMCHNTVIKNFIHTRARAHTHVHEHTHTHTRACPIYGKEYTKLLIIIISELWYFFCLYFILLFLP